jgi:hypothetical protein
MRIDFHYIPGLRHFRLDNGPLLIGIAAVAAVFQAVFLFSLFLPPTTTSAADTGSAAPLRVISAATRGVIAAVPGEVPCSEQTWPYLDRKCLAQAAEKRPSHGARTTDLNAPPEEVGAILRAAAPGRDLKVAAKRDSFNDRFWPGPITTATIKPSTTGTAPKPPEAVAAPKPPEAALALAPETRTLVARPAREIRRPAAPAPTRTATTAAAAREVRSDIVQGPDGRQWKRTTYSAPVAGGGTKTFQITRPLQQSPGSWGTFARGF